MLMIIEMVVFIRQSSFQFAQLGAVLGGDRLQFVVGVLAGTVIGFQSLYSFQADAFDQALTEALGNGKPLPGVLA